MKPFAVCLVITCLVGTGMAQAPAKPSAPKASAKPAVPAASSAVKLPPGVPPARGLVKTAFSLRFQDIQVGKGVDAEPNKVYKVHYTGYLAADGHKFDSSFDHKTQVMDKDGKPELDTDGKPKMKPGEPISFPQGFARVIPGFDQGFTGMKVGGKRRLFIPWQLAYGARGRPGPNAANPGIPPKADLIFDIELVDQSDLQMPQGRPGAMGQPGRMTPKPPQSTPGTSGAPATGAPSSPAPTAAPAGPPPTPPAAAPPPASAPPTTPPADKPQSKN